MFALTASQRFFLYSQAVDMRKSFDGLSGIVTTGMGKDVLSGDVYVFIGKSRDKSKLLVWEKAGFVLYYKRLEKGTFFAQARTIEFILQRAVFVDWGCRSGSQASA